MRTPLTPIPRRCAFLAKSRCAGPPTARPWSPPREAWSPTTPVRRSTERSPKSLASHRRATMSRSPPDAPWLSMVNARLAALKGEPAPATDAAAIPEAQRPMIEGMVSKLATRLASTGGGVDEWSRLIRAYTVLHEADKAKAALVDAHKALAADASAVASLDALARNLGLGDAN